MRLAVVILAAGMGTRMKSSRPKVLHEILGRPMMEYIVGAARKLKPARIIAVANPRHTGVHGLAAAMGIEWTSQDRPLGTADAVKAAFRELSGFSGSVLVLNGDTPLITAATLKKFVRAHVSAGHRLSVLSFRASDPFSYGRIVRDGGGVPFAIVEERDLSAAMKDITEVNSGVYLIDSALAGLLDRIKRNPRKGEYYLTDLFSLAVKGKVACGVLEMGDEDEFHGVNSMKDLSRVQAIMQRRITDALMAKGVMFYDPGAVIIHPDVRIGAETVIYPSVCLEGGTVIGRGARIHSGTRIVDSRIGDNVTILDNTLIEGSRIKEDSVIGPHARVRPVTLIGKGVKVGNFVEVKNSRIGDGTKASHLSYIGDAVIGRNVNIGAGTITCNFDGLKKHRTVIGDDVFVGSDSQLIAPVRIGKGAFIAAGSTITDNVPAGALGIGRAAQKIHRQWALKRMKRSRG